MRAIGKTPSPIHTHYVAYQQPCIAYSQFPSQTRNAVIARTAGTSFANLPLPHAPSDTWACMPVALYLRVSIEEQREMSIPCPRSFQRIRCIDGIAICTVPDEVLYEIGGGPRCSIPTTKSAFPPGSFRR